MFPGQTRLITAFELPEVSDISEEIGVLIYDRIQGTGTDAQY